MSIDKPIRYKGGLITLQYDEDPQNCREWGTVGTILYLKSSRYILGDKAVAREDIQTIEQDPNNIWFPVYAYAHSTITLSLSPFSCPWDSGQSGIIYCTKKTCEYEFKGDTVKLKNHFAGELTDLTNYLNGNVASVHVTYLDEESLCGGFYPDEYGSFQAAIDEGKEQIDEWIRERYEARKKAFEEVPL